MSAPRPQSSYYPRSSEFLQRNRPYNQPALSPQYNNQFNNHNQYKTQYRPQQQHTPYKQYPQQKYFLNNGRSANQNYVPPPPPQSSSYNGRPDHFHQNGRTLNRPPYYKQTQSSPSLQRSQQQQKIQQQQRIQQQQQQHRIQQQQQQRLQQQQQNQQFQRHHLQQQLQQHRLVQHHMNGRPNQTLQQQRQYSSIPKQQQLNHPPPPPNNYNPRTQRSKFSNAPSSLHQHQVAQQQRFLQQQQQQQQFFHGGVRPLHPYSTPTSTLSASQNRLLYPSPPPLPTPSLYHSGPRQKYVPFNHALLGHPLVASSYSNRPTRTRLYCPPSLAALVHEVMGMARPRSTLPLERVIFILKTFLNSGTTFPYTRFQKQVRDVCGGAPYKEAILELLVLLGYPCTSKRSKIEVTINSPSKLNASTVFQSALYIPPRTSPKKPSSSSNSSSPSSSSSEKEYEPPTVMTVPFGGEELRVVVTTCEEVCKTECDKFLEEGAEEGKNLLLGVDCEWFPNVSRFLPSPLAVLQLCFGKTVLVIQLLGMGKFPECIAELFQRSDIVPIGYGVANDVEKISRSSSLSDFHIYDLKHLGVEGGLMGMIQTATEGEIHLKKDFSITISNWNRKKLTPAQIRYCAIDAYATRQAAIFAVKRWKSLSFPLLKGKTEEVEERGLEFKAFFEWIEKLSAANSQKRGEKEKSREGEGEGKEEVKGEGNGEGEEEGEDFDLDSDPLSLAEYSDQEIEIGDE